MLCLRESRFGLSSSHFSVNTKPIQASSMVYPFLVSASHLTPYPNLYEDQAFILNTSLNVLTVGKLVR
ncbi:hypothetical protein TSMEX_001217 [Taenia solium]|eukprot:TsM_000198700 transcript=TsM_000198700 gene=TsM_000198700